MTKKKCKFHGSAAEWVEQSPDSVHRYRVNCSLCGKFYKWGTAAELAKLKPFGLVSVLDYKPPATLEALFEDDE
jgi:hypothetical protein